jgi:hypothetical protein
MSLCTGTLNAVLSELASGIYHLQLAFQKEF